MKNKKVPIEATDLVSGKKLVFTSIKQAMHVTGTTHVKDVLRGIRKQSKGYTFSYAEKEES